MFSDTPESLIGMSASDQRLRNFLSGLKGKLETDQFAEIEIWEYPDSGAAIYFDKDQRVNAIFLYGCADEVHDSYEGVLPLGLTFRDCKTEAMSKLGSPTASGAEKSDRGPWARFDFETYSAHIQFRSDLSAVNLITLMSPAMATGNI